MGLSPDLISQFTELTNNREKTKKETTVYGGIVDYGGKNYVQLDGSELLTPIITTVEVKPGDRVTVLLKNHTATVTGNITSPAAQTETVKVVVKDIEGLSSHTSNSDIHVTSEEKAAWNAKANQSDIPTKTSDLTNDSGFVDSEDLSSHTSNSDIHVTSEEKAAWNAVNYSNPNQLINPDFKVNQKGLTSYSNNGYTVDHWRMYKHSSTSTNGTISVTDNGIHVASGGTKLDTHLQQYIENWKYLEGKTVTLSFEIDNLVGSLSVCQFGNTPFNITTNGVHTRTFNWKSGQSNNSILFYNGHVAQISYDLKWAKLELGSIATPFVPPDFATELLRIQAMDGTIPSDTVDGKHAADFSQNLGYWRDEKSIKEYVTGANTSGFCIISSQVVDMPVAGAAWMGIINCSNGSKQIIVYKVSDNKPCAYSRIYFAPSDVWYDWVCLSDGGNADTVDGKHASDFSQIINLGNTSTDTKTAIGIPYKTTTYWCAYWTDYPAALYDGQGIIIAVNYKGSGPVGTNKIWCRQLYIPPFANSKIYQRIISDTNVGKWTNIADGGNAASVGVYTEAKLAELEARLDLLDGDHIIG